jgi:hypothetical protein
MSKIYGHSAHLPLYKEGDDEEEQTDEIRNSPIKSYKKENCSQTHLSPHRNKMLINRKNKGSVIKASGRI